MLHLLLRFLVEMLNRLILLLFFLLFLIFLIRFTLLYTATVGYFYSTNNLVGHNDY